MLEQPLLTPGQLYDAWRHIWHNVASDFGRPWPEWAGLIPQEQQAIALLTCWINELSNNRVETVVNSILLSEAEGIGDELFV